MYVIQKELLKSPTRAKLVWLTATPDLSSSATRDEHHRGDAALLMEAHGAMLTHHWARPPHLPHPWFQEWFYSMEEPQDTYKYNETLSIRTGLGVPQGSDAL